MIGNSDREIGAILQFIVRRFRGRRKDIFIFGIESFYFSFFNYHFDGKLGYSKKNIYLVTLEDLFMDF